VRDLESTNGTYLTDERARIANFNHFSVFRIGPSIVMMNITPKLAVPPVTVGGGRVLNRVREAQRSNEIPRTEVVAKS
jgi:pSer/pThr/pTyr-binding forkhead associated (FHA) protein